MINEGINKHYQRDVSQRVVNNMVNMTNVFITAHNNNEAIYAGQEEINDLKIRVNNLNKEVLHLQRELRGNMDNDDVSHDETIPVNNALEPNNTIGAYIVEENEDSFYDWVDTYDEWNGYYHTPTEKDESGSSHTFTGDNNIFRKFTGDNDIYTITRIKQDGTSKTRIVSETSTSMNSDFYTGKLQK